MLLSLFFFRLMSAMRNVRQSSVIFINQLRNKINVMYGSPETTSGGIPFDSLYRFVWAFTG